MVDKGFEEEGGCRFHKSCVKVRLLASEWVIGKGEYGLPGKTKEMEQDLRARPLWINIRSVEGRESGMVSHVRGQGMVVLERGFFAVRMAMVSWEGRDLRRERGEGKGVCVRTAEEIRKGRGEEMTFKRWRREGIKSLRFSFKVSLFWINWIKSKRSEPIEPQIREVARWRGEEEGPVGGKIQSLRPFSTLWPNPRWVPIHRTETGRGELNKEEEDEELLRVEGRQWWW
jgi:hypothetical protein